MEGTLTNYLLAPSMLTKFKAVAALPAFLLGGFGAPDFYLGHKKAGTIELIVWAVGMTLYMSGYVSYVQSLTTGDLSTGPGSVTILGSPLPMVVGVWASITFTQMFIKGDRYATDANGQSLA